tara:strand:- start:15266 stop:16318 length:1053 start_codon:yes stop_codon:yes gene_type:complete
MRLTSRPTQPRQPSAAVPDAFTLALLSQANTKLGGAASLLRAAGLPYDPVRRAHQTRGLSRAQYSRLSNALFVALGDESGAVMSDARTPPGTTRLIALSMLSTPNLGSALQRGIEFNACCRVQYGTPLRNALCVDSARKEATLSYRCMSDAPARQHHVLCNLAIWLRFCGWLVDHHIDIVSASCAGPKPPVLDGMRHFFPCPVTYDADVNAVTFSARHLEANPVRSEDDLNAFLKNAPFNLVVQQRVSMTSITHRIRDILGDDFRREMPSFEALTGLLNMSARTLRRRLEKEGTSYQRIKDNARRDLAISCLSGSEMTVSDVAELLGFSDPSAFHRSFKKWTGQSPGAFR